MEWQSEKTLDTLEPLGRSHSRTPSEPVSLQDVSSLLTPFEAAEPFDDGSYSMTCKADKGKGKAKAADMDDLDLLPMLQHEIEDDADTDEEDNVARPVPRIVISNEEEKGKAADNVGGEGEAETDAEVRAVLDDVNAATNDQSWIQYLPPAALTDVVPGDIPEELAELIKTSVSNLQAQAALAVAAHAEQAEREAEAAEAEAAREREEQQKTKLEPWQGAMGIAWPQARELPPPQMEPDHAPPEPSSVFIDIHAGKNSMGSLSPERSPSPTDKVGKPKRLRRHLFASRLLRHVHVYGSERGESSSSVHLAVDAKKSPFGRSSGESSGYGQSASMEMIEDAKLEQAPYTEGMAPISAEGRSILLQSMKEDSQKKKEPVVVETIECISCFDDIPVREAVKTVCHSYCLECFRQLITTALDNEAQFPPKCCLNEVPYKTVMKYVPRALGKRYKAKADEFKVPVDERLYCPFPDCGVFVPKKNMSSAAKVGRCRNGHETCTVCRQPAHGTGRDREPCPEDPDQRMADDLAADEGWRRCIRCGVIIEHREACQHMTCRCGAQFCYVCGATWRTCQCSLDDLHRLKNEAAERHRQREIRERDAEAAAIFARAVADRELEELREALRQVEEYEREETRKLEERRQEHRRRLQALRELREAVLRSEIERKYATWRDQLATVEALQWSVAQQTRRHERAVRREADRESLEALDAAQAQERESAEEAAATRIAEAEADWEHDYKQRVRLEAALEEAYYREQLMEPSLWAGRKDRLKRIAAAFDAYRRRNDLRHDEYLRWRTRELEKVRFVVEEERCMQSELLYRARVRAFEDAAGRVSEERLRHAAERTWCRAVSAERLRLVQEAEEHQQALGLEGSSSDTDGELLMLIELEQNGGLDGADMDYSLLLLESMNNNPRNSESDTNDNESFHSFINSEAGGQSSSDISVPASLSTIPARKPVPPRSMLDV